MIKIAIRSQATLKFVFRIQRSTQAKTGLLGCIIACNNRIAENAKCLDLNVLPPIKQELLSSACYGRFDRALSYACIRIWSLSQFDYHATWHKSRVITVAGWWPFNKQIDTLIFFRRRDNGKNLGLVDVAQSRVQEVRTSVVKQFKN